MCEMCQQSQCVQLTANMNSQCASNHWLTDKLFFVSSAAYVKNNFTCFGQSTRLVVCSKAYTSPQSLSKPTLGKNTHCKMVLRRTGNMHQPSHLLICAIASCYTVVAAGGQQKCTRRQLRGGAQCSGQTQAQEETRHPPAGAQQAGSAPLQVWQAVISFKHFLSESEAPCRCIKSIVTDFYGHAETAACLACCIDGITGRSGQQ